MFARAINITESKICFLFGPRQTGKSTYVINLLKKNDLYIDLLPQINFQNYAKKPGRVRDEILTHLRQHDKMLCIIDEIQKIPDLQGELRELIKSKGVSTHF